MIGLLMRVVGVPKWAAWAIGAGGIAAVLGGAVWLHGREVSAVEAAAYRAGWQAERRSWQAARAELLTLRTNAVARRDDALAGTLARIRIVQERESDGLARLLARRPAADRDVQCFDDDLVHAIEAGRAAVRSAAAAGQRGAAVPGKPGAAAASDARGNGGLDDPE